MTPYSLLLLIRLTWNAEDWGQERGRRSHHGKTQEGEERVAIESSSWLCGQAKLEQRWVSQYAKVGL